MVKNYLVLWSESSRKSSWEEGDVSTGLIEGPGRASWGRGGVKCGCGGLNGVGVTVTGGLIVDQKMMTGGVLVCVS